MFPKDTRILLAEDTAITRTVIQAMLQKLGYENVTTVGDGGAAETEIKKYLQAPKPYGLVISDWNMPRLSGLALLRKVRETPRTHELPFILLTSNNEKEHVLEAIRAGVTGYLTKPFPIDVLEKKLQEAWNALHKAA